RQASADDADPAARKRGARPAGRGKSRSGPCCRRQDLGGIPGQPAAAIGPRSFRCQTRDAALSGARRRVMRSATLLPWIVAFKAFKTVMLIALGITLLTTRRANASDVLVRFALALHLPLTSRVFNRALVFASHLTAPRQTALAITAFAYAALM